MLTHEHVTQSAAYLREKLPFTPEIGIVLGSGLGPLAEEIDANYSGGLRPGFAA